MFYTNHTNVGTTFFNGTYIQILSRVPVQVPSRSEMKSESLTEISIQLGDAFSDAR